MQQIFLGINFLKIWAYLALGCSLLRKFDAMPHMYVLRTYFFHENARLPSSPACTTWRLFLGEEEPRSEECVHSFNFHYSGALRELCLGKSARIKGHVLVNFIKHCARKTSTEAVGLL